MKWTCPALLVAAVLTVGCQPTTTPSVDFTRPLPPHARALRKLSPEEFPDFGPAASALNRTAVLAAIDHSLTYLARPGSEAAYPYTNIDHVRAVDTLLEMRRLLGNVTDGPTFNAAVRERFDVYQSVGGLDPDGQRTGQVLFTGYCTPVYAAARVRGGPYQFPIYRRPADPTRYTRRQIEADGALAGDELAWLTSRFDAYVVTVQGSARLRLPDGSTWDVGTAGTNGQPYVSPGRQMVADGVIPADQLNLPTLRAYVTAHPDAGQRYLLLNPRTAFFTDAPGGPFGKLNVPVTPMATIATDKPTFPAALPAFIDVPLVDPDGGVRPFRGLMLDQDTGGGIRAAGRCDIYFGVGPDAERRSGQQLAVGRLYYLVVRAVTATRPTATSRPASEPTGR